MTRGVAIERCLPYECEGPDRCVVATLDAGAPQRAVWRINQRSGPGGVGMSVGDLPDIHGALDQMQIVSLLHRYSDSVTRGDLDRDEELFTPDAVIEIGAPFDTRIEGSQAIRQWRTDASVALELLVHTTYSPVVHLLGPAQAEATSQTREMVRSGDPGAAVPGEGNVGVNVVFYSVYFDDLVKVEGEWKFARRFCQPIYMESGGLTGQVCTARAAFVRAK